MVHKINNDGSSELLNRHTIVPEFDRDNKEMCATEIVLCPPVREGGPSLLICENRYSVHPKGDALALFEVSPDGAEVQRAPEPWVHGAGTHLRGLACDPSGRFVCVLARDSGGMTMYERTGDDGLLLREVARLAKIEKTVVPIWI